MQRKQNNNRCAACKHRRRACAEDCVFAPYFPSPAKDKDFENVHRLHGSEKIIKFIKAISEGSRDEAMASITFAANARARDPVYGCVSYIKILSDSITQSQKELADVLELLDFIRKTYPSSSGQQQELLALFPMETDDPLMEDLNEEEEPETPNLDDNLGALLADPQGLLVSGDQSGQVGNMNANVGAEPESTQLVCDYSGVGHDDGSGLAVGDGEVGDFNQESNAASSSIVSLEQEPLY